jgi:hypothetical protein
MAAADSSTPRFPPDRQNFPLMLRHMVSTLGAHLSNKDIAHDYDLLDFSILGGRYGQE